MKLSNTIIEKIRNYLQVYLDYLDSEEYSEDQKKRSKREKIYKEILGEQKIYEMTELEFGQVISSLWATQMWGNKSYLVDGFLDDNDLDDLKLEFAKLLWGKEKLAVRYETFKASTKGFGTAIITEILAFIFPEESGIWNNQARKALTYLGFKEEISFLGKSQLKKDEFSEFNEALISVRDQLAKLGIDKLDLLDMNYFLFEVASHPGVAEESESEAAEDLVDGEGIDDFEHDDAIDKLVAIGVWLGFDAEKEKQIAKGARVDTIWQAKIANLGVVTYVFEVQRRGSVDSLILNLQKAQNNPSVQRLVIVALSDDIQKIKEEILTLPEGFRKSVSYLEVSELYRASKLLSEFSGIIERLDLVQSEFGFDLS